MVQKSSEKNEKYRRCLNCNDKSHKRYWKTDQHDPIEVCPICGSSKGWMSSAHGEMDKDKLKLLKEIWMRKKLQHYYK